MRDFLTLKMLPLALSLIKPEKRHLLAPLAKNHPFYMGNCSKGSFQKKIKIKKVIFLTLGPDPPPLESDENFFYFFWILDHYLRTF